MSCAAAEREEIGMQLWNKKNRGIGSAICCVLLALTMLLGPAFTAFAEENTDGTEDSSWTVSRSKKATELEKQNDGTYTSNVTLSLPSTEEVLESDVVFVLDESDCEEDVYKDMWELMQSLNEACSENPGAKLNVGVVFFRGCASTAYELQEYNFENYEMFKKIVEDAKENMIYKGSNLPAGLYAAKEMLDASDTPKSRQHMILVSDGKTYIYTHDKDPESHYSRATGGSHGDGNYIEWELKYGTATAFPASFVNQGTTEEWESFLSDIEQKRDDFIQYDQEYIRSSKVPTVPLVKPDPEVDRSNFVINVEESLYQSASAYQEIVESGVKCYAYYPYSDGEVFTSFMKYLGSLGEGNENDFDWVTKDIVYLMDKGSTVTDVIGLGTDDQGNEYNFDFVNDASKLSLKVGDVSYACTKIEDNHYGFGEYDEAAGYYPYELVYHPAGYPESDGEQEYFEWKFNVKVSNFERTELTYQVSLTNPQTTEGTYTGLLTNRSATLYAVATDGRKTSVEFEKPVLSYTVPGTTPSTPEEVTPPSTSTPGASKTPITPTVTQNVNESTTPSPIPANQTETQTTTKTAAKTGDESKVTLYLILLLLAVGAMTYIGKKKTR